MALTLKQLIRALQAEARKLKGADCLVGIQDHDNCDNELSGHVKDVRSFDPETSFDPKYCRGVKIIIRSLRMIHILKLLAGIFLPATGTLLFLWVLHCLAHRR